MGCTSNPSRRTVLKGLGTLGLVAGGASATAGASAPNDAVYRAGAARTPINPTDAHLNEGLYLGGYGGYKERGPATGIYDDISARALAVSSKGQTVAFLVVDTVGLGNEVINRIRTRAAEGTDIDPLSILVGSTHSHSAPDFQGLWGGVPDNYLDYVVEQSAAAVRRALESAAPARLFVGETQAPKELVSNRRGYDYTDRTLTAIQFRRKLGGENRSQPDRGPIATVVNFAVHTTVIGRENTEIATDFVGPLERGVEGSQGGVAIYFTGAQGDVVPDAPDGNDGRARAQKYGHELVEVAETAVADARPLPPSVGVAQTTATFPQDNPAFDFAYIQGWYDGYYEFSNTTENENGQEVPKNIVTPITRVTLGRDDASLEAISIPGEATTPLGADVRQRVGGRHQALLGLTQNALGYIIPEDQWMTGRNENYEESVSLGKETAPRYRAALDELYR